MSGLASIAARLAREAGALRFGPPVAFVYNPLRYAWRAHRAYLERYGGAPKRVLFLGMNPGPWGMAQTGVPFGEVGIAAGWLGLAGPVGQPENEHPRRPVAGFDCRRSEVSGRRLWGLMKKRFARAEDFFAEHFVANYCPLLFLTAQAGNLTPDKLPASEREALFEVCDRALAASLELLRPDWAVGVGRFAEKRLLILKRARPGLDFKVAAILHPSPANPAANRGWEGLAAGQLEELGLWPSVRGGRRLTADERFD